jgi:hypothetical protein
MKVGDLVRVRETAFDRGWHDSLLAGPMLVVNIETVLDGTDIDIAIAPVVQVLTKEGLRRINDVDLEIANESR